MAQVRLAPASAEPTPKTTWQSAQIATSRDGPGSSVVRTVLATVGPPYLPTARRAWVVIECNVPFTGKGGGSSEGGTVVAAVDGDSGRVLFSQVSQN